MLRFAATATLLLCILAGSAVCASRFEGALNKGLRWRGVDPLEVFDGAAQPQYFTQTLDHFDATSTRSFQQKFYVNDSFFDPSHPRVLLFLGGEGPLGPSAVSGHFVLSSYAQQVSALLVSLEHRFYGESLPVDSSPTDIQFLSSKQAIEDVSVFHDYFGKLRNVQSAPWVVAGGSYSGALAAWTREKLPSMFVGAIASSGPVFASVDFPQYLEVVARSVGPTCAAVMQKANLMIESLLQTRTGMQHVSQKFNTCTPITPSSSANDLATFFSNLLDNPSGVVQYSDDNNNYQPFDIRGMCSILTDKSYADPLSAFAAFTLQYNEITGAGCTGVSYADMIAETKQWPNAGLSWTYQTCTEFGWFQTGESRQQPFSSRVSLQWFLQQCQDLFNIVPAPDFATKTNDYYGGRSIASSDVVFPFGSVDPWHAMGIISPPVSPDSVSLYMNGTAHCADLYPARSEDLPALTATRATELKLLAKWFGN